VGKCETWRSWITCPGPCAGQGSTRAAGHAASSPNTAHRCASAPAPPATTAPAPSPAPAAAPAPNPAPDAPPAPAPNPAPDAPPAPAPSPAPALLLLLLQLLLVVPLLMLLLLLLLLLLLDLLLLLRSCRWRCSTAARTAVPSTERSLPAPELGLNFPSPPCCGARTDTPGLGAGGAGEMAGGGQERGGKAAPTGCVSSEVLRLGGVGVFLFFFCGLSIKNRQTKSCQAISIPKQMYFEKRWRKRKRHGKPAFTEIGLWHCCFFDCWPLLNKYFSFTLPHAPNITLHFLFQRKLKVHLTPPEKEKARGLTEHLTPTSFFFFFLGACLQSWWLSEILCHCGAVPRQCCVDMSGPKCPLKGEEERIKYLQPAAGKQVR